MAEGSLHKQQQKLCLRQRTEGARVERGPEHLQLSSGRPRDDGHGIVEQRAAAVRIREYLHVGVVEWRVVEGGGGRGCRQ
eukprot:3936591-Rhodomonas_salina.5